MAKTRKGIMACEGQNCESHDHGQKVIVFENERGTLSYSCDWCGRAPYAKVGTGQHREWLEALGTAEVKPVIVPEPGPAPAPKPAQKKPGLLIE